MHVHIVQVMNQSNEKPISYNSPNDSFLSESTHSKHIRIVNIRE